MDGDGGHTLGPCGRRSPARCLATDVRSLRPASGWRRRPASGTSAPKTA